MTLRACSSCGASESLDERGLCSFHGSMEVQQQMAPHSLLIHSPYDIPIKQEPGTGSPDHQSATSDMLFSFGLPSFMQHHAAAHNNNSGEIMNHNARAAAANACTKDRKRPYPCNICPSRFGSKMELEEHQNSHTGQKPFECDVCKARFNRRSTLWNHKRIHSDAKPFVCSVCQMTFKWKNSLKCHKEMHLRKNESSSVLDNDLRQLTYATAAKRTKVGHWGDFDAAAAAGTEEANIIPGTTPSPTAPSAPSKKKKSSSSSTSSSSSAGVGGLPPSALLGGGGIAQGLGMQDGSPSNLLGLPTAHIDIDQASLDTLVHQNNGNILVQLCSEVDPHLGRANMLGMDDGGLLSSTCHHLFGDLKNEFDLRSLQVYSPSADGLGMGGHQPTHHINVNLQIPIVSNMFNFGRGVGQSLPSVHHLTSTASSLPSVSVPMDYSGDLSQSQYIVSHNDMMPSVSYQQNVDPCLVLTSNPDYMSNYDFPLINHLHPGGYETNASTPGDSHSSVPSDGMDGGVSNVFGDASGKAIPHDRW